MKKRLKEGLLKMKIAREWEATAIVQARKKKWKERMAGRDGRLMKVFGN